MKPFRSGLQTALVITMLATLPAFAAEKAVNLSLFTPISLVKPTDSVSAFRFNLIYGKNTSVQVVDLGLINQTTSGLSKGLQWGAINVTDGDFHGIQLAAININNGNTEGFAWSGINYAKNAKGLQLAVVNYAQSLHGVQLGVLNIIKHGGFLPVCIIANWSKS
jgi:hypothetical protein